MELADALSHHPAVLVAVTAALLYTVYKAATAGSKVPGDLPWVGKTPGSWFGETRAAIGSFSNVRQWLAEGYSKYSQKGKAYVFPDLSGRAEIIIPNNKLSWLLDHPDDMSSVSAAHYEMLCGDYAFTHPYLLQSVFHEHVIHRNLARRLSTLIPGMWEEIVHSFDTTWGSDEGEWKDIPVWDNVMDMIAHVSNRMFVGLPLCRDEGFLKVMSKFAMGVIGIVAIWPFVPSFLQPIVGPILAIPNHLYLRQSRKWTMPVIQQRLADIEHNDENPDSKVQIPDDFFTWYINTARAEGKTVELQPDMIARFLMPIEFAAIHTTTLTMTNVLFDLLGSDPEKGFIEGLREEAERVFKECNGVWDKQSLNKLVRADSAVRESMRVSNFATRGVQRKVMVKGGIRNEEEGWTAPYGSFIAVDIHSRHHDPEYFPDPNTYDAFRFSRQREEFEAKHTEADKKSSQEYLRMQNLSLISTGETHLPFGHGKHACPGRFFVQHETKMILAHMVMTYDLRYLPKRPENLWFGQMVVPPQKDVIQVRRRSDAVMKR